MHSSAFAYINLVLKGCLHFCSMIIPERRVLRAKIVRSPQTKCVTVRDAYIYASFKAVGDEDGNAEHLK